MSQVAATVIDSPDTHRRLLSQELHRARHTRGRLRHARISSSPDPSQAAGQIFDFVAVYSRRRRSPEILAGSCSSSPDLSQATGHSPTSSLLQPLSLSQPSSLLQSSSLVLHFCSTHLSMFCCRRRTTTPLTEAQRILADPDYGKDDIDRLTDRQFNWRYLVLELLCREEQKRRDILDDTALYSRLTSRPQSSSSSR